MKLKYTLLIFSLLLSTFAFSQQVSNIHFEQVGKKIHIYYDLEGDQTYTVQVFYSMDNGKNWGQPLKEVSGAVGASQKHGQGKVIFWDVLAEREKLSGNIRFRIEVVNAGTYSDQRDGQTYRWIKIGEQIWMAENLNYKTGDSWCYDNKATNCNKYGRLYNWKSATTACPDGWHLPSNAEWSILVDYLGGSKVAGSKLKETGTTHWQSPNTGAANESGFSALPGGCHYTNGGFDSLGYYGYWWLASRKGPRRLCCYLNYDTDKVSLSYVFGGGFSVRCVRD